jgi:hypothetical protein
MQTQFNTRALGEKPVDKCQQSAACTLERESLAQADTAL